jgi:hypothetical protein
MLFGKNVEAQCHQRSLKKFATSGSKVLEQSTRDSKFEGSNLASKKGLNFFAGGHLHLHVLLQRGQGEIPDGRTQQVSMLKTFFLRHFQRGKISSSVCPCQAFLINLKARLERLVRDKNSLAYLTFLSVTKEKSCTTQTPGFYI